MTRNADTTINEKDELFIKSIVEEAADENNENTARERQQLGFVTLNGNLVVREWFGLAYDR